MQKKERSYDYFWNSKNDRYYDADSMGDWIRPFFKNGIFNGQMQVTANNDMSVTIAAGYGYINGKHRHFLTPTTLDLEVASGTLNRIDAVMLRRDDTERKIYLLIVKGGNAATPTAPQPTRNEAIYELKLADIYIAAGTVRITQAEITDTRMNTDVCGWVVGAVKQIDFSQIQAQFDSFFHNCKEDIKKVFNEFVQKTDGSYDQFLKEMESYLTNLETTGNSQLSEIVKNMVDYEQSSEQQWQEWFAGIQQALASVENGEMLAKLMWLMKNLYSMADQTDIDRILNETYVDVENEEGIFEIATTSDIDDIIGGTYIEQPEDGDLLIDANIEE